MEVNGAICDEKVVSTVQFNKNSAPEGGDFHFRQGILPELCGVNH
jgi:hypothetical protein